MSNTNTTTSAATAAGKTILAIGAHVGDMELTAGALLASCAVAGGRAVTLALTAGEKGHRFSLPNARIMIHQPWGGAEGKASDIEITCQEILRLKQKLNEILSSHSGQPMENVVRDTDRDHFMSAEEACKWGLIDQVLVPKKA